jgi:hypothetical protein
MKCGLWVGGLVLAAGAWAPSLRGQEALWRSVGGGPTPVTLAASELAPCPVAALDRPVAVVPPPLPPKRGGIVLASAEVSEPASFPVQLGAAIAPAPVAAPVAPPVVPAVYRPGPGSRVIAVSASELAPAEAPADPGSEFAVDRRPRIAYLAGVRQAAATAQDREGPAPGLPAQELPAPQLVKPAPASSAPFGGLFSWSPLAPAHPDPDLFGPPPDADPLHKHFYVKGEYLLWWLKGDHVPPLVTTSAPQDQGFLGAPTTRVLFGGNGIDTNARNGARFTAGCWLDQWCDQAVEISGFFLTGGAARFTASSADNPVLARPFFNVNTGTQFSELVASPGVATGTVSVSSPNSLWGLETNWVCKMCCGCDWRVNAFAGLRFLDFNESLTVTETIQGGPAAPAPFTNSLTTVFDRFGVNNAFYGGQVGLTGSYKSGPWVVDLRGQVALGSTYQSLRIDGNEQIITPTGTLSAVGGLLALPSNIGSHHHATFSVVPEVALTLGYQVNPNVRLFVGYDFLYWTGVARAGEQIDTALDVTKIPFFNSAGLPPAPGNHPQVVFRETDFWAQGLLFGVQLTY